MIIVSDTNILSSLAAANALPLLQQLFARSMLSIPPAVRAGMSCGRPSIVARPILSRWSWQIRYCQANGIDAVGLPDLLRLFWTRQFITRAEVEHLISRMEQVERLTLSEEQRAAIFAPQRRRR